MRTQDEMQDMLEVFELNVDAALQQQEHPVDLFFRDDDVDLDEPSLERLLDLFLRYEAPINLAVIPGSLTDAAAATLRKRLGSFPTLIELDQHGWRHLNHESEGKKCEFGPSRSYPAVLADLAEGISRMNQAFGDHWSRVFVPPWNRCSDDTIAALRELQFHALSRDRGRNAQPQSKLLEIPITLDLFHWRGGVALRSYEDLAQDFSEQIRSENRIGVMLHHKVMDDEAFTLLETMLRVLQSRPNVILHTFQSLINKLR